jgi:hypothetical protein
MGVGSGTPTIWYVPYIGVISMSFSRLNDVMKTLTKDSLAKPKLAEKSQKRFSQRLKIHV